MYRIAAAGLVVAGMALFGCEPNRGHEIDESTLNRAFPQMVDPKPGAVPRIGMARLARNRSWPLLRRWRRGADLDRAPMSTPAASPRELQLLGEQVMRVYCVGCHGPQGRGDGPMAARMRPAPRDFRKGPYKFRTTPTGRAPTMEDIFGVVTGGLRGTPMPAFADLPEEQRWGVAAYIMTLQDPAVLKGESIEVPPTPDDLGSPQRVSRGAVLYHKLGCDGCHGARGDGDGPLAAALKQNPRISPPAVFSAGAFKRGGKAQDLFLTLATGIDGTAMLSFRERATDAELFDVIAFVQSLRRR